MRKSRIQPFPFQALPSYMSDEVAVLNPLLQTEDKTVFTAMLDAVASAMQKYLGDACRLRYAGLASYRADDAEAAKKDRVGAVFFLPKLNEKVAVYVPLLWAKQVVDRLLGGKGQLPSNTLALSALEQGVFEFFILKLLQAMQAHAAQLETPYFSWEYDHLVMGSQSLPYRDASALLSVQLTVEGSQQLATIELVFDGNRAMRTLTLGNEVDDAAVQARAFSICGHLESMVTLEAGRVSLSVEDQAQLEEGDVLLFDEAYVALDGNEVEGESRVRCSFAPEWVFHAHVTSSGEAPSQYEIKIESFEEEQGYVG